MAVQNFYPDSGLYSTSNGLAGGSASTLTVAKNLNDSDDNTYFRSSPSDFVGVTYVGGNTLSIIPTSGFFRFRYAGQMGNISTPPPYGDISLRIYTYSGSNASSFGTLLSTLVNKLTGPISTGSSVVFNSVTYTISSGEINYTGIENYIGNSSVKLVAQISAEDGGADSIRLSESSFTFMDDGRTALMPLYISGPEISSGNIPLYLNSEPPSGDIPLFIEGHEEAPPTGIPLYTAGGENVSSGLDLYINSDVNKSFDLFIKSLDPTSKSGNIPLYIHTDNDAVAPATKAATLFIKNFENSSGNISLYTAGPGSGEYSIGAPLFIKVEEPEVVTPDSGGALNSMGLYVSGPVSFTNSTPLFLHATPSGDSSIPLYMNSENGALLSNSHPMFISNLIHYSSGNMQLFTKGPDSGIASIPFFIKSITSSENNAPLFIRNNYYDIESATIPLVVQNKLEQSGGIPLHIVANTYVTDIPLYLKVNELLTNSGNMGLFINSTQESSIFSSTNLYMSSEVYGARIPLFVKTDSIGYSSGGIPLYMNAGYLSNNSMDLYIPNSGETAVGSVRLSIAGEGITPDGLVSRSQIPLYMSRDDESVSSAISLVMNGPTGVNSGIEMYINGGSYVAATLELSMPSSVGPQNSEMKLYTHGF